MDDMTIRLSDTHLHNGNNIRSASNSSFTAKLKRLKIEESVLLHNITNQTSLYAQSENKADPNIFLINTEFKKFFEETKRSLSMLKQLYQDIKASTSSKEVIKTLDIDDIKKNTLELENNIKTFKIHLQKELTALKSSERLLTQKLNDPILIKYLNKKSRVQTAKYTEVVPSPVKTLMTSPLKSLEVHEFQEFMKNSKNRYGGWDEYHHNIFVNIWRKHFDYKFSIDSLLTIEKASEFNSFLRELLPKLQGLTEEEVVSHVQWYTKYLHLKDRQQKAIDEWRSNRRKMKPSNVQNVLKKDCINKSSKKKKRTPDTSVSSDNVMSGLTGENELIQDLMLENGEIFNDLKSKNVETRISVRFTRKCVSDELLHESRTNKEAINYEEYSESNEQTVPHFSKTTKQWNIRCCSKNIKSEGELSSIESIKKLGTPLWRAGL